MALDVKFVAPDNSKTISFKAENIQMTITRSPTIRDVAGGKIVPVEVGRVIRRFVVVGLLVLGGDLADSGKKQLEDLEQAFTTWWNKKGSGGAGGPSGTIGKAVFEWGTKSTGATKKYFIHLISLSVNDDARKYGGKGDTIEFTINITEVGDAKNAVSQSG